MPWPPGRPRPSSSNDPLGVRESAPLLIVADTGHALTALTKAARARSHATVVAVTGSVGKTSTKEMLALALARLGATHASHGNLNNEWGVPLSLSRLPQTAKFGVFEAGMNHAGEIAPLSRLLLPDLAIITTVEAVHLGNFPSIEAIANEKAEIFAGMDASGVAIINFDNAHYEQLAAAARRRGLERVIGFGEGAEAPVRLLAYRANALGSAVQADIMGRTLAYEIGAPGRHLALNSVAALAAVAAAGGNLDQAASALANFRALAGRGARFAVPLPGGELVVIDEAYNAGPASMRAAIAVLAETPCQGRRVAALGDMLELGADGPALHAALARTLIDARIDLVFTAGPLMRHLHEALPAAVRGEHAASADALLPTLTRRLRAGDALLVKGSNASAMSRVVRALKSTGDVPPRKAANG